MPPNLPNNGLFDIEIIQKFLPHRYPFLLVDRVLEMKEGESIVAIKNVTYNEPYFQGHFPGRKIMPGVLQVEALAQAGGILIYNSIPDPETKYMLFVKIDKTRFRKIVVPGDQLTLKVQMLKLKSRFCIAKGTAYVDGDLVLESEIVASLVDIEELNVKK
jgi:3-hydroxyacyl-[acyl-carrier-protein] dehydratase/UDP-3-O-[3-hydroxymyristoyl] N-acetylglucosamine deacetylase/3-hydroxyacyl-[acyl-carrier-protein] dehydratase